MILRVGDRAPGIDARPVFGLPVRSGTRPLGVVFIRSLSGGLARLALAEAAKALARIEARGGSMVAFTTTELSVARDIVPRDHMLIPVVAEPGRSRFEEWGVGCDRALMRSVRGLLSRRNLNAARRSLMHGRGAPLAGIDQLPAEFVLDRDGVLVYAHYAETIWDLPDPEALCAALSR